MKVPQLPLAVLAGLAGIGLALVAGATGYATGSDGTKPAIFDEGEAAAAPYTRGVVQEFNSGTLTLATPDGPLTLKLAPQAPVEALRPVAPSTLSPGDWLNGGAMRHPQTILALTGLVAIAAAQQGSVPE